MCTLSFLPTALGYVVAMNRDELLSRGAAQPPAVHSISGGTALFPTDVEGGTWIGVTERGDTWALLNRNGGERSATSVSRGQVVLGALSTADRETTPRLLRESGLSNFLPFRLFGISVPRKEVTEWIWDANELSVVPHGWRPNHWFSSGISDAEAAEVRGKVFEAARQDRDFGTREWLRRMHRSHGAAPGAFSVCVHRDDAATVSYTEIDVGSSTAQMFYHAGSPCQAGPLAGLSLPLTRWESSLRSL